MTTTVRPQPPAPVAPAPSDPSLSAATLPRWAPFAVLAGAAAAAALLLVLLLGFSLAGLATLTVVLHAVAIYVLSRSVEGRRRAADRLVTTVVTTFFALALVPLVSVVYTVLDNGLGRLDLTFLISDMRGIVTEGGGAYHAILGTLVITGIATLISVPIGLMTSIYLVEYGRGRLARAVTFLVDVMTGIPSIVAGLFAYALFVLFFGPGVRLGIAGSVALSVLMIPVVIRSSEEMLRLVPSKLREAAYALGVPKWRTVVKVVLPTAMGGIATGVTLALARVIGETAPLLIVAGFTRTVNLDPFDGRMMTLPVYVYYSFIQPGVPPEFGQTRAWSAALILIIIVMGLNLVARLLARLFAPKSH